MTMNKSSNIKISALLFAIFIGFTVLVMNFDVEKAGASGTEIGFAGINTWFRDLIGTNDFFYGLTEISGYIAILTMGLFGLIGLIQLIKRKSLLKVDNDILMLGGFYAAVLACYVAFEKIVINYRPILTESGLEASYPSSHCLLVICVMMTAAMQFNWRLKEARDKKIMTGICIAIAVLTVIGRMLSGVHWFTDIVGGVLLSAALVYTYYTFAKKY